MRVRLILSIVCAFAAPASAADLASLYRAARTNDPVYAEAQAKLQAAREKSVQGRAALLPNISLSGNVMQNQESVENRTAPSNNQWSYDSRGYTLSLTQPLFRWQNWVGYDQSRLVVAQAEAAFLSASQDLILRTAQAYLEVLRAQANLEAAKAYQVAVASQLVIAQEAFRLGTGIKTDMFDAQTRAASAASQVLAAQADFEVRQAALEAIVGQVPSRLGAKREPAQWVLKEPGALADWLALAEQSNLTIQQQRLAAETSKLELERQKAGHYPTLDLVASTGYSSTLSSGSRLNTDASRMGLQLNIPLYQGGDVSSRHREAAANLLAVQAALDSARRSAALATRQAHFGVTSGLAQIEVTKDGVVAAQNAMQSNSDAFAVGVRLNLDVLNAQSQVLSMQRELYRATVDTIVSQLKLKAAAGSLGESDVAALSAMLE